MQEPESEAVTDKQWLIIFLLYQIPNIPYILRLDLGLVIITSLCRIDLAASLRETSWGHHLLRLSREWLNKSLHRESPINIYICIITKMCLLNN